MGRVVMLFQYDELMLATLCHFAKADVALDLDDSHTSHLNFVVVAVIDAAA